MARKSARQIAAAKRNIVKAQLASARSRKGKKRSGASGHHYGTGRKGRKATRTALYGKRRHGLSPTQKLRRKQRARPYKNAVKYTASAAVVGYGLYRQLSPAQKQQVKTRSADFASKARHSRATYSLNRQAGGTRKAAAKNTGRYVFGL